MFCLVDCRLGPLTPGEGWGKAGWGGRRGGREGKAVGRGGGGGEAGVREGRGGIAWGEVSDRGNSVSLNDRLRLENSPIGSGEVVIFAESSKRSIVNETEKG